MTNTPDQHPANDHYRIDNRQQASVESRALIGNAQREIIILLHDYDESLLPPAESNELFSDFLRRHDRNSLRYLCAETDKLRERGARLLDLARRFSSYIKMRQLPDDLRAVTEQFILIDGHSSMHQQDYSVNSYFVSKHDRVRTHQHDRRFEELWQRSAVVPGIHVTGLSG